LAWYNDLITQTFGTPEMNNTDTERGVDLATPFHTAITNLFGGTVTDASYHPWGGVVGISTNVPGHGNVIEYFQHLDQIDPSVTVGSYVPVGGLIGLSGGQLSGGSHPASAQYSTGPHTEFGFNSPYVAGGSGLTGFDPMSIINQAINGTISQGTGGSTTSTVSSTGGIFNIPFFDTLNTDLTGLQNNFQNYAIRTGLIVVGVIIIIIGIAKFIE